MGFQVLFCIGEQLPERENGTTNEVCAAQLAPVFALGLKQDSWEDVVVGNRSDYVIRALEP